MIVSSCTAPPVTSSGGVSAAPVPTPVRFRLGNQSHVVEVAHEGGASDGGSAFDVGSVASKFTVAAS